MKIIVPNRIADSIEAMIISYITQAPENGLDLSDNFDCGCVALEIREDFIDLLNYEQNIFENIIEV